MPAVLDAAKIDQIQRESITTSFSKIAQFLQENLGQKMAAYIGGLNDPKEVGAWIRESAAPREMSKMRMRCAYQVVRVISEAYDVETAKAWLFGTNTRLKDEAPASLMRNAQAVDELQPLVPVARAFVGFAE